MASLSSTHYLYVCAKSLLHYIILAVHGIPPSTVQGDTKTFFQFLKGSKGATPTCAPPEVHGDKRDPEEKQQLDREAGGVQGVPARGKGSGQA